MVMMGMIHTRSFPGVRWPPGGDRSVAIVRIHSWRDKSRLAPLFLGQHDDDTMLLLAPIRFKCELMQSFQLVVKHDYALLYANILAS